MWISAAYLQNKKGLDASLAVRVKEESEELLIQDASSGEVLHRWPFAEISTEGTQTSNGSPIANPTLVYFRDERGPRIIISDLVALRGAGWAWRLPEQPAPQKSMGYGPPVSLLIILIGLVLVAYEVFSNPTVSLEKRLYDSVRVFAADQVCTNAEGLAALDSVFKKVLTPSSEMPLRVQIIRGDETNLFAFPGGRIFVYEGLLQKIDSPDEFADLLAHFTAHASLRHPLKALNQQSTLPLFLKLSLGQSSSGLKALEPATIHFLMRAKYTAEQENAALVLTDQTLSAAQVNPNSFIEFVQRMKMKGLFPSLFTTHSGLNETRETKDTSTRAAALSAPEWSALKGICAATAAP